MILNSTPKLQFLGVWEQSQRCGCHSDILLLGSSSSLSVYFLHLQSLRRPLGEENGGETHRKGWQELYVFFWARRESRSYIGNRASQTFQSHFQFHILYFHLLVKKLWFFYIDITWRNFTISWKFINIISFECCCNHYICMTRLNCFSYWMIWAIWVSKSKGIFPLSAPVE